MASNNFYRLTIAVLFLIVSFLMPYYHDHDYHSEYHVTGSEHYDGFEKYDMYSHKHTGFHLHLEKYINGAGATGKFQNKLKNTAAHFTSGFALTHKKAFHNIARCFDELMPESNFTAVFSGVSPPVG